MNAPCCIVPVFRTDDARIVRLHMRIKGKTLFMYGSNIFLLPAVIPQKLSRYLDTATNGRIRYHSPLPDCLIQLIPGNQATAIADEVNQQFDHLWLGVD